MTLCQNKADVQFQMDIDSHTSLTVQAGKIRLTELIFPAFSVGEIWWKFPLEIIQLPHSGRVLGKLLLSIDPLSWPYSPSGNTRLITPERDKQRTCEFSFQFYLGVSWTPKSDFLQ